MTEDERPTLTFSGRWRSLRVAAGGIVTMLKSQHKRLTGCTPRARFVVALADYICHHEIEPEWCLIVFAIIAVWVAEALNTAIGRILPM